MEKRVWEEATQAVVMETMKDPRARETNPELEPASAPLCPPHQGPHGSCGTWKLRVAQGTGTAGEAFL